MELTERRYKVTFLENKATGQEEEISEIGRDELPSYLEGYYYDVPAAIEQLDKTGILATPDTEIEVVAL